MLDAHKVMDQILTLEPSADKGVAAAVFVIVKELNRVLAEMQPRPAPGYCFTVEREDISRKEP